VVALPADISIEWWRIYERQRQEENKRKATEKFVGAGLTESLTIGVGEKPITTERTENEEKKENKNISFKILEAKFSRSI